MNANELADGILAIEERIFLTKKEHQLFQNSATMLRQQQAEIEALKLQIHTTLTNRDLRTYDGKTEMNNEPVAWAVWEGSVHDMFFTKEDADELCRLKGGDAKSVPLYTHQYERPHNTVLVPCDKLAEMQAEIEALKGGFFDWSGFKELTDEEIDAVGDKVSNLIDTYAGRREFAKAILRKASEK